MKKLIALLALFCVLCLAVPAQDIIIPKRTVAAGGAPSDFVTDSFTEASDMLLGSHTGELGATWTKHGDAVYGSVMNVDAATDRIFPTSNPSAFYASGLPPSANYTVCTDVFAHSNISVNIGPCGRMDTSANTMYCARYNSGTSWDLRKIITGTQSTLSTSTSNLITLGTSKRLCLVMNGSTISMTVDGATEGSPVTDTDISAAGRAGVRSAGGSTTTTGFHLDNFSAQ